MKLLFTSSIETIHYVKPILVADKKLSENNLLKWQVFQTNVSNAFAEGSLQLIPLFHQSNINELKTFLVDLFLNNDLDFNNVILTKPFFNIIKISSLPHIEFIFCAETILFEILRTHFTNHLPKIHNENIRVNALASLDNLPENTDVHCLKIKIQPNFSKQYFFDLKKLLTYNKDLIIRLDGNRQFKLSQLNQFLEELSNVVGRENIARIEYIEEALSSPDEYIEIFKKFNIPQALDESVLAFNNLQYKQSISSLVLKPSVLSISKCFDLIKNKNHQNLKFVISSTYEPAQTLLSHFYLTQLTSKTFHGLGTLDFLPKNYTNIPSPFFLIF